MINLFNLFIYRNTRYEMTFERYHRHRGDESVFTLSPKLDLSLKLDLN